MAVLKNALMIAWKPVMGLLVRELGIMRLCSSYSIRLIMIECFRILRGILIRI